ILLVRYSNDISLRNLQGAQWGLLAMLLFAGNDLTGKWSTLLEAELFPTLFYMFVTGASCFGVWWLRDRQREQGSVARDGEEVAVVAAASEKMGATWSPRRTFLVGMAVGITNVVGMMFIVTAFDLGKAGLVSAVTALNVLIVLLYTRLVVKEVFSRTELIGIVLAFAGIVLMRLFGA
ncbi:EamA family transporter, partial [Achromobacter sp. PAB15]|uniref:EamA family transporter n=1 Tax=Achromobacter sp. PAB15 TaxID=3233048 RepID=UPI003F8F19F7